MLTKYKRIEVDKFSDGFLDFLNMVRILEGA
jgi:hypothetical protein